MGCIANHKYFWVSGHRQIRIYFDPPDSISFRAKPRAGRRCHHTGGPDNCRGSDALCSERNAISIALCNGLIKTNFDTQPLEILACPVGKSGRKGRQDFGQALHENDSRISRIDLAKVSGKSLASQLRDCTGHFNPGWATADNNEIQKASLPIGRQARLQLFQRPQESDAASRSHRQRA